jgi:hypothetical protein
VAAIQTSMIKDQRIKTAAGARMGAFMVFLLGEFKRTVRRGLIAVNQGLVQSGFYVCSFGQ